MLRQLVEKKRGLDACRERARAYQDKYPKAEEEEQVHLDAILDVRRVVPTLDDCWAKGFAMIGAAAVCRM